MNNFLLEIYGEELPSSAQRLVEKELDQLFSNFFSINKIGYSKISTFASSRRIAVLVENLNNKTEEDTQEIRGPSTDTKKDAIQGFLKKHNVKLDDLKKKNIKNKEYYFLINKTSSLNVKNLLQENIPIILRSIKWKKSMRWSSISDRWIRPIKNILCIFEKELCSTQNLLDILFFPFFKN